jgi:hypothetical protein
MKNAQEDCRFLEKSICVSNHNYHNEEDILPTIKYDCSETLWKQVAGIKFLYRLFITIIC